MPLKKSPPAALKVRPRNSPWTGKPHPVTAPAPAAPRPSILDLADRQSAVAQRRRERGTIADGLLRREVAKHAHDPNAHPLRRFRLLYPTGPLSVEDLAELSGVSSRSIARIENDNAKVVDAVLIALAAALIDPSSGRPVRPSQLDRAFI
jgi:DNA-binding XRE family transcriptional regulator